MQPSEVLKLAFILTFSFHLSKDAENIYNDVFLKFDPENEDPKHLASIYEMADEFIENLDEADRYDAYSKYVVFAKGRGDTSKMKEINVIQKVPI